MGEITKCRNAMMLLAGAAVTYAIGTLFAVIAYATFTASSLNGLSTFTDLGHASDWFHFVGALAALGGVCAAGWEMLPRRQQTDLVEIGVAAVATLLIAIGALVQAASSSSTSTANAIGAVGIGGWALLALSRAVRYNLAGQQSPTGTSVVVPLWLTASGGLVLLAIGSGFTVGPTDRGLGIAAGVLQAIGVGLLAQSFVAVRSKGMLGTRPVRSVIEGLVVLSVGFLTSAVVAGIVFTPTGTLTGLRVGVSLTGFILAVGVLVLGWAAWTRVSELVAAGPGPSRTGGTGSTVTSSPTPPAPPPRPEGDSFVSPPPPPTSAPPEPPA